MIFGPCQETSFSAIHVGPRVDLYSPREESFPTPLKYIDVSRTTHTNLDVKQEKHIDDYWNIDGSRDLSDTWTGFTQFTPLEEKPPEGYMWSGWRLTRKQLGRMKSSIWRMDENCEGSMSLTLRTRNSKKPSRTHVRSWQHLWLLLCPAKL